MEPYEQEQTVQQSAEDGSQGHARFWESFPKPTGWSAHWDGVELDRAMDVADEGESEVYEKAD